MRELHFDMVSWKYDVESYARWSDFYEKVESKEVKQRIYKRLVDLQAKWPYHKLGEMPIEKSGE